MSGLRRLHAQTLLASLQHKLMADTGMVKLTNEERRYLLQVCDAALADRKDPLGIARRKGGQVEDGIAQIAEARMVFERVRAGETIRAACIAVGNEVGKDGSEGGAVEKNYRKHRVAIEAGERFYAALREGHPPDGADTRAMLRRN